MSLWVGRTWPEREERAKDLSGLPDTEFCLNRRWQLHLFPSWRKSEGQSCPAGEPRGLFTELCSLYDLLVSHVRLPRRYPEGQAALPEARGVRSAGLDGGRAPRRPLEGRACLAAQISETVSGMNPHTKAGLGLGSLGCGEHLPTLSCCLSDVCLGDTSHCLLDDSREKGNKSPLWFISEMSQIPFLSFKSFLPLWKKWMWEGVWIISATDRKERMILWLYSILRV